MKIRHIAIFALSLILGVGAIAARDPTPLRMLKHTSNQVLITLQRHKSQLNNKLFIRRLISRIVLPKFAITTVSRSVIGQRYWNKAAVPVRRAFVQEFTGYVIDMYASALAAYSDEKIIFRPIRAFNPSQTRVQIYSQIRSSSRHPIQLNYRLLRRGSNWKIYDFSVDRVSMVRSYRAQFADTLRQGGLKALVAELRRRK